MRLYLGLVVSLFVVPPSFAAVALNNVGTSDRQAGAAYSGAFSVTAGGQNLGAFAGMTWDGDGQTGTMVCTYGGQSMTAGGTKSTVGTNGGMGLQWFYLTNPPTGSNTLACTVSGGTPGVTEIYANLISFTGVNQATPIRSGSYQFTVSSTAATNTFTAAINSSVNDQTVSCISDDVGINGTNQTQEWSNTTGISEQYADKSTTPAASVTHTWTFAGSGAQFVWAGFSIQPASGGGASTPGSISTQGAAGSITTAGTNGTITAQ